MAAGSLTSHDPSVAEFLDQAVHVDRVAGLDERGERGRRAGEADGRDGGAVIEAEAVGRQVRDQAADSDHLADHGGEVGQVGVGDGRERLLAPVGVCRARRRSGSVSDDAPVVRSSFRSAPGEAEATVRTSALDRGSRAARWSVAFG